MAHTEASMTFALILGGIVFVVVGGGMAALWVYLRRTQQRLGALVDEVAAEKGLLPGVPDPLRPLTDEISFAYREGQRVRLFGYAHLHQRQGVIVSVVRETADDKPHSKGGGVAATSRLAVIVPWSCPERPTVVVVTPDRVYPETLSSPCVAQVVSFVRAHHALRNVLEIVFAPNRLILSFVPLWRMEAKEDLAALVDLAFDLQRWQEEASLPTAVEGHAV